MKIFIEILKFLSVFLLYVFLSEVISPLFMNDINSSNLFISNISQITIILISLTVFIILFKNTLFKDLFKIKKNDLDIGFKAWTIGLLVMIASNFLITLLGGELAVNEEMNRQLIDSYLPYSVIAMCINAPIVEELIFRKSIRNIFRNKYLFIIISGLLFGTLHILSEILSMSSLINLLYVIPYSALGISFAYMYYKTDNIWTSIIFHAIHNSIAILLLVLM